MGSDTFRDKINISKHPSFPLSSKNLDSLCIIQIYPIQRYVVEGVSESFLLSSTAPEMSLKTNFTRTFMGVEQS